MFGVRLRNIPFSVRCSHVQVLLSSIAVPIRVLPLPSSSSSSSMSASSASTGAQLVTVVAIFNVNDAAVRVVRELDGVQWGSTRLRAELLDDDRSRALLAANEGANELPADDSVQVILRPTDRRVLARIDAAAALVAKHGRVAAVYLAAFVLCTDS